MNLSLDYIAGIFDGEGCVSLIRRKRTKQKEAFVVCALIANTDRELLEIIKDQFGGSITEYKSLCPKRKRACFQLQMSNSAAVEFLKAMLPYSFIKIEQIVDIIEWYEKYSKMITGGKHKLANYEEIYADYLAKGEVYRDKLRNAKHVYTRRTDVLQTIPLSVRVRPIQKSSGGSLASC